MRQEDHEVYTGLDFGRVQLHDELYTERPYPHVPGRPEFDYYVYLVGGKFPRRDIRWFDRAVADLEGNPSQLTICFNHYLEIDFGHRLDAKLTIRALNEELEKQNYLWRLKAVELYNSSLCGWRYEFLDLSSIDSQNRNQTVLYFEKFGITDF